MSDFRSDTLTVADAEMRSAMAGAEVGDDFYGEDPTAVRLERAAADLVGTEAALLVTNGTLANLIAVLAVSVGDQVIAHADSDLHRWEAHSIAGVGGRQVLGLPGPDGRLDPGTLAAALAADDPFAPRPGLVAVENSHSASGGRVWTVEEVRQVAALAHAHGVPVLCDGARLFNAAVAGGTPARELAAPCDVVTISLYKGLGAPMGSLLCGTATVVERARVLRRRLGLTFRQIGHLAAAGIVALRRIPELARDHRLAAELYAGLLPLLGADVLGRAPQTNIVVLRLGSHAAGLVAALRQRGVLVGEIVPGTVRFVTHRDLTGADVRAAVDAVAAAVQPSGAPRLVVADG